MTDKEVTIQNIIDHSLTPETAKERGYEFIDNVFDPYNAINEFIQLATIKGYKFGKTSITRRNVSGLIGLYIEKKNSNSD